MKTQDYEKAAALRDSEKQTQDKLEGILNERREESEVDISTYSGTTVMLTVEGRLTLTVDALAAAQKTRKEERQPDLQRYR